MCLKSVRYHPPHLVSQNIVVAAKEAAERDLPKAVVLIKVLENLNY